VERDFVICPHCAAKGKHRELRAATKRTPHVTRSDGKGFHLYLEESVVSRPHGATEPEVAALFRYDCDPAGEVSESSLVRIRPAGGAAEAVSMQLEQSADRLAEILQKGDRLAKTYQWTLQIAV
jgi:hypothetical protein